MFRSIVVAAALVVAAPAVAITVPSTPFSASAIGNSFTVNYGAGFLGGTPQAGLTAKSIFRLSALGGSNGNGAWTDWTFTIDYLGNTSGGPVQRSRLSGFGFNVAPNIVGKSSTGMFDITGAGQISNGVNVEVCFRDAGGGNGCSGGANGGLWGGSLVTNQSIPNGNNPVNTFTLRFGAAQSTIILDNFVVRYQAIDIANGQQGGSGIGVFGAAPVPEPASWAMMIAGFGLVGAAARRRKLQVA
ncbi:cistern family PEP-CTERM protein [Sandarakinorhabdus sp.]|uniref:cistern family PEP-CTERM protein n=1 Tax=Sandarakinorhabdus sp. TaxID=1916663 RepID=UPI00286D8B80|nr:cistern family PEP-CTERM protein [Sandarakinorhabdus sp.]